MTTVQQAIRDCAIKNYRLMEIALKQCKTSCEFHQCRMAYAELNRAEEDVIAQRHGLPGRAWYPLHPPIPTSGEGGGE